MIKSSAVAVTQFSKLRKLFVYNTIEKNWRDHIQE